jgi:hypothetical protein
MCDPDQIEPHREPVRDDSRPIERQRPRLNPAEAVSEHWSGSSIHASTAEDVPTETLPPSLIYPVVVRSNGPKTPLFTHLDRGGPSCRATAAITGEQAHAPRWAKPEINPIYTMRRTKRARWGSAYRRWTALCPNHGVRPIHDGVYRTGEEIEPHQTFSLTWPWRPRVRWPWWCSPGEQRTEPIQFNTLRSMKIRAGRSLSLSLSSGFDEASRLILRRADSRGQWGAGPRFYRHKGRQHQRAWGYPIDSNGEIVNLLGFAASDRWGGKRGESGWKSPRGRVQIKLDYAVSTNVVGIFCSPASGFSLGICDQLGGVCCGRSPLTNGARTSAAAQDTSQRAHRSEGRAGAGLCGWRLLGPTHEKNGPSYGKLFSFSFVHSYFFLFSTFNFKSKI